MFFRLICFSLLVSSPVYRAAGAEGGEVLFRQKLPAVPNLILLTGKLGGKESVFKVDTGASDFVADNSRVGDLVATDETMTVTDSSGIGKARRVYRATFQVQQLEVKAARSFATDLQPFSRLLGPRVAGVIGAAPLAAGKLLLNHDESTIELHTGDWKLGKPAATEIELQDWPTAPIMEATIEGRWGQYIVDTGFRGTICVEETLFTSFVRNGTIQLASTTARSQNVFGQTNNRTGWFLKGELMGRNLAGVNVTSVRGAAATGMLGVEWLYGFNIELDWAAKKLRYQVREHASPPPDIDLMLGAILTYSAQGAQILNLQPGVKGAAEKAGLRPGDEIVEFQALRGAAIDRDAVAAAVSANAGQQLKLRYVRKADGKAVSTAMSLPKFISVWEFSGRPGVELIRE